MLPEAGIKSEIARELTFRLHGEFLALKISLKMSACAPSYMSLSAATLAVAAVTLFSATPAAALDFLCNCESCCSLHLPLSPKATPSPTTWGGVYVGVTFGFTENSVHQSENGPGDWPAVYGPGYNSQYSNSTGHIAVHGGYNQQFGTMVIGVEGDVGPSLGSWSRPGPVNGSDRFDVNWDGSLRLRGGYSFGKFLIYGTAGPAIAEANMGIGGFNSSKVHLGWTGGIGGEYAFSPNWIGRFELRYSKFGNQAYQTTHGPVSMGWDDMGASIGLSHKF